MAYRATGLAPRSPARATSTVMGILISPRLGSRVVRVACSLLVVGVAVPTPGGVGGFHYFYKLGLTAFYGAPADRAVGAAIVLRAVSFVPVAIVGLILLAQEGLSLSRVGSLTRGGGAEEAA